MSKGRLSRSSGPTEMSASKKTSRGVPSERLLRDVIRRVVEAVHPEKIILFGSAARGEMGPRSDLDLLVVKNVRNRRETAWTIERNLRGTGIGVDLIVATPEDLRRYGDSPALVYYPALKEGRVIYGG